MKNIGDKGRIAWQWEVYVMPDVACGYDGHGVSISHLFKG